MSNHNELSYDRIAGSFSGARNSAKVPNLVVEFCQLLKPNSLVLDIGCGTGIPITKYLVESKLEVIGIDISAKLLQEATSNVPKARFIKADITNFATEQKFAGIVAWDSLFHLQLHEHEKVFSKLYQLLEKNGYLLFTHGGAEGEITGEMFGQKFTYSSLGPEKTKDFLKQSGFKIIKWFVDTSEENKYMMGLVQKV